MNTTQPKKLDLVALMTSAISCQLMKILKLAPKFTNTSLAC